MIIQGYCTSDSKATTDHRVKVTVPGICENVLMDTVNGLYLRNGEQVFVYFMDNYLSPLVIGRVSGQFEISKLDDVLNSIISKYNNHFHPEYAALLAFATACSASVTDPVLAAAAATLQRFLSSNTPGAPTTKISSVKPDDFLY